MNMAGLSLRLLFGLGVAFGLVWLGFVLFLSTARPKGLALREAMRLVPDTLRLLGRLAGDRSLPKGVRIRLGLVMAYLALPFDIVPDFIPVIGYLDDVILLCVVLRSTVRRAGPDAIRRHWPGTEDGLAELWRLAGLSSPGISSEG
jgi:uncharacterized membrane protein YkvA (DUF1232 family)